MGASPQLYMTPQLSKRRDGLAPSLLDLNKEFDNSKTSHSKSYRTSTKYLNAGNDELQTIIEAIHANLEKMVDANSGHSRHSSRESKDLTGMKFEAKGCMWVLKFNPYLRADAYQLIVVCSACSEGQGYTAYVVETSLINKGKGTLTSTNEQGYKEAKACFDNVALQARKAVVKCEFPDFPEGCKGRPFREVYQLNARLKSGSFATVCRGTHRATGKKVAVKCVLRKDLPPSDDAAIYDEVAILASLTHPHIVPLLDFFDEKDCYFIVMELMGGGDLFDRIGKKKSYSEADARDLCAKMIKAVAYCHTKRIAHCDMKPKNLLLVSDENDSYIKLADFGFAARVHQPKSLTKQCGTPFFVSPEILMRQAYDQQSDMWSVGCIVFLLLGGNLPFMGRTQKELFRKIVVGKYEFDSDWQDVSTDARDLVMKMLITNPDDRITAQQALRHKWIMGDKSRLQSIMLTGTSQRLKTFNARMKLRSAMIAVDWVSSLQRSSSFFMKSSSATSGTDKGGGVAAGISKLSLMEAAKAAKSIPEDE